MLEQVIRKVMSSHSTHRLPFIFKCGICSQKLINLLLLTSLAANLFQFFLCIDFGFVTALWDKRHKTLMNDFEWATKNGISKFNWRRCKSFINRPHIKRFQIEHSNGFELIESRPICMQSFVLKFKEKNKPTQITHTEFKYQYQNQNS